MQKLGDGALRFARPDGIGGRVILDRLRSWPRVTDVVVTTEHVCIYFDPSAPPQDPRGALDVSTEQGVSTQAPAPVFTVRARYDGEDLGDVAVHLGLSIDEVANLHAAGTYTVAMVGFLPGFAYLRGGDPRLTVPRRPPRLRVPAGAIGIAAGYTGVYPFDSPGGWSLLGTAVDFAAFSAERGAALGLGDAVRFERVP